MENAKQKAIRLAYGIAWDKIDLSVQENILKNDGWTHEINESWLIKTMGIKLELKNQFCRPKSLQGIETNNGWIRIESEADLPSENNLDCYVFRNDEIEMATFDNETKKFYDFETSYDRRLKYVTHYQPIVKPLKPHY